MVNGILFGEILDDPVCIKAGYTLLDNWLEYAAAADIHEFSSPTYYWVQLNALYMGWATEIFSFSFLHWFSCIFFFNFQEIAGGRSLTYTRLLPAANSFAVPWNYPRPLPIKRAVDSPQCMLTCAHRDSFPTTVTVLRRYIYAARPGARQVFGAMLDRTWTDIAASYFAPTNTISGAHSRDYDFMFGHGALMVHLLAQSLPNMKPIVCEYKDTHCERADSQQNVFAYLNLVHPAGYTVPAAILDLTKPSAVNELSAKYMGQDATSNGNQQRFAHRYNYVRQNVYSIGSASQDYITNTHSKYFPGPQDKLIDLELGELNMSMVLPTAAITVVPDYLDAPYG